MNEGWRDWVAPAGPAQKADKASKALEAWREQRIAAHNRMLRSLREGLDPDEAHFTKAQLKKLLKGKL